MIAQYRQLRESISTTFEPGPLKAYGDSLNQLSSIEKALEAARTQAAAALRDGDAAAYHEAARAAQSAARDELRALEDALQQKLAMLTLEERTHQISAEQKVRLTQQSLDQEYAAELAFFQRNQQLAELGSAQSVAFRELQLEADRRYLNQRDSLTRQSLETEYRDFETFGQTVTGAFNGQLRGLLNGTESWRTAFKNTLEELTIKFMEWTERSVVQYLAGEAAKTSATTAGVAARTGAEEAGAAASLASQATSMIRSILSSAAEAFAGVFGFLAPVLGPAAAGPAAGAYGTVAAMAGAVASADIGMWRVPQDMLTLVHHNELIMPATEAGALRSMLSDSASGAEGRASVQINPAVHFNVQAIDGGSVSQWMRNNSSQLLKAVDEAVRHGALTGTRRIRSF